MENYSSWIGKRVKVQNLKEFNKHGVKNGEEGIVISSAPPCGGKRKTCCKI